MSLVSHRRHRQVHLVRMREQAGCDRIQPHRQFPENPGQRFGGKTAWGEVDQRVDDLAAFDIGAELVIRVFGEKFAERRRPCGLGELLQDRF